MERREGGGGGGLRSIQSNCVVTKPAPKLLSLLNKLLTEPTLIKHNQLTIYQPALNQESQYVHVAVFCG